MSARLCARHPCHNPPIRWILDFPPIQPSPTKNSGEGGGRCASSIFFAMNSATVVYCFPFRCEIMKRTLLFQILLLLVAFQAALAIQAPVGLVSRTGDRSVVL